MGSVSINKITKQFSNIQVVTSLLRDGTEHTSYTLSLVWKSNLKCLVVRKDEYHPKVNRGAILKRRNAQSV
jgi:hypothetical protein